MLFQPLFAAQLAAITLSILAPTVAPAADCAALNIDPLKLGDGRLLYQRQDTKEWVDVDETTNVLAGQQIAFAFVIQEKFDQGHNGVAIVKSARKRQLTEPALPNPRQVDLVRNTAESDTNICRDPIPGHMSGSVSTASYDAYHDYGSVVTEQQTLDSFHYNHPGRKGRCTLTNSLDKDARGARSNRGQFSFDPRVVRGESTQQIARIVGAGPAFGSSELLSEQRVELQAYRVRRGFPSCLFFNLKVPARAGILRINDLEGLKTGAVSLIRDDERSWQLSR